MTKRFSVRLLAIGIIAGIALLTIFISTSGSWQPVEKPVHRSVASQQKQVAEKEAVFKKQIDSLHASEIIVTGQLNNTKQLLEQARKKNYRLQARVQAIISKKDQPGNSFSETSSCDTLKTEVAEMIIAQSAKDSLSDSVTAIMEQQLQHKDTLIKLHRQQYNSVKAAFENNLSQQKSMEEQLNQYRKYFKRQKAKKKITAIGIVVVSAFAAKLLMK
jgi:ASC-1-like (ASCH) protein